MNIELQLQDAIQEALKAIYQYQNPDITLSETKKEFEGTHTFITFQYAKELKQNPEQVAQNIGKWLINHSQIVKQFNVVKGFLNLVLTDALWQKYFQYIYEDENFGEQPLKAEKVMVEFSSPNTNKPLHLGHLRNNFLGDALANILEANGYEVIKTNLVNDRGIHICKSMLAYQLFGNQETPESSGLKGDHFAGKYYVLFNKAYQEQIQTLQLNGENKQDAEKNAPLIKDAQEMLKKWEQNEKSVYQLWQQMNDWVYEGFEKTYQTLGIKFDKIYYESQTYLLGKDIIEEGLEKGIFFKKEDNSVWIDLTAEKLDQKLLLRGDGTSVYITQDLGTADLKYSDFHVDKSIYVVGNEQDYHFKVLFAILKKLGRPYAEGLYHLSYGMVDLPEGKMKSREGTVVDADELIAQVIEEVRSKTAELGKIEGLNPAEIEDLYLTLALGALKYFLLKVEPKKRMLFNPNESVQLQGDTGPFIQYTYARISALMRKAQEEKISLKPTTLSKPLEQSEKQLIFLVGRYPLKLREAADNYSPAVLANYLYELAKAYNQFYAECSIFYVDEPEVRSFRLSLSQKTAEVIQQGMKLLGIGVPERM